MGQFWRALKIEGVVKTWGLVDIRGEVPSFTFKRLSSEQPLLDDRQALADVVLVQVQLATSNVTLTRTLQKDPDKTLMLQVADEENTIDIIIANIAPFFLHPEDCDVIGYDEHFELYYHISQDALPPVLRESQIPFKGKLTEKKVNVEYPPPPILDFVEDDLCLEDGLAKDRPSSSNRPICTQVEMQPGDQ